MRDSRSMRWHLEPVDSPSYDDGNDEPWLETRHHHHHHHHRPDARNSGRHHHHHHNHHSQRHNSHSHNGGAGNSHLYLTHAHVQAPPRRRRYRDVADYDLSADEDHNDSDTGADLYPRRRPSRRSTVVPYESRVLNPHLGSSLYSYVPARRSQYVDDDAAADATPALDCPCNGWRGNQHAAGHHRERGRGRSRDPDRARPSGEASRSRHRGRSRGDGERLSDNEEEQQQQQLSRRRSDKSRPRAKSRDHDDQSDPAWNPDQSMAVVAVPRATTSIGRRYVAAAAAAAAAASPSALTRSNNRLSYPPFAAPYPRYGFSTSAARTSANAQPGPLAYHVAASFVGKDIRYDPARHTIELGRIPRHSFPSTSEVSRSNRIESGHDSFFIADGVGDDAGAVAVGVTDGVGGFVLSGIDPGDFSHLLCANMAEAAAAAGDPSKKQPPSPRAIMLEGYTRTCHDPRLRAGGSTACVAVASSAGLDVANLGDSGYVVLRARAVHSASVPQTHAFNTPYQLAMLTPKLLARATSPANKDRIDLPSHADVTHVALRRGDVVVLATDGVWDNLFGQDVLQIANRIMKRRGAWEQSDEGVAVTDGLEAMVGVAPGSDPGSLQYELATELVASAKVASQSKQLVTPFGKSVQRHYPNEPWHGGKVDDICVVVMVVTDAREPPRSRL